MARADNPFPAEAVATRSMQGLWHYPTHYTTEAESKIDNFLEDFDSPNGPVPLILGIRGRYGSGKTHLALHLIDYLAENNTRSKRAIPTQAVYQKADRPDLYEIYRNQIAGQLKEKDLRQLIAYHYRKLLDQRTGAAPAQQGRESTLQVASRVVQERSAEDPALILEMLRKDLLPVGDLPLQLGEDLRQTEPSASQDFFKAYSKIEDSEFGPLAYRWIHGDQLNETEAKQLGVTLARIEPKHAKEALRFLLNAYRRAGVAFLFCLDEFERFRLPAQPGVEPQPAATQEAVRQVLKDLSETFRECGQILVVSGTVEAWTALPEDVRMARFTPANTIDVRLEPAEAQGLLEEYCRHKENTLTGIFEPGALERLFEVAEYNARRLLQIAHHAYSFAEPYGRRIAARDIPEAAAKALGDKQRIGAVQDTIRAVAGELGQPIQANVVVEGRAYAFAIGDAAKPVAFVDILRSFFKMEEVEDARIVASAAPAVAAANPQAQTCVVVAGYSSPEVRAELGKAVNRVIVYDEDRFEADFREFLRKAMAPAIAAESTAASYNSAEFDRIASQARAEYERLQSAIAELSSRREAEKQAERTERVGKKLEDVLDELDRLVQDEEEREFRLGDRYSLSAPMPLGSTEHYPVLDLLVEQRQRATRALRLNEGQPREAEFEAMLAFFEERLLDLQRAIGDGNLPLNAWLDSCRMRRKVLRDMRKIQDVRLRIAGLGRWSFLGPLLWLPGWMRLSLVLGVVVAVITFLVVVLGWNTQMEANRDYVKALNNLRYSSGPSAPTAQSYRELMQTQLNAIQKATSDFEIASPSGSPVVASVLDAFRSMQSKFDPNFGPERLIDFIDSTRRYLASISLLRFLGLSVFKDPGVWIPFVIALVFIAIPLATLLIAHFRRRRIV